MNTPVKSGSKPPYWLKVLHQRIPITRWLRNYSSNEAVSDLIAGITVGLTVMPQSLAYATLAGLDPQYGLYSAFAGSMVYVFFGSCKDITIGPTALMSLMTHQQVMNRNPDYAILLCFLSGIIHLLMSVLHLGVLIDFISIPVTVGFTSATSVIITVSQIKGLLGLSYNSSGFLDTLQKVYQHIGETSRNDALLGIICIIVLILLRKIKDINLGKYRSISPRQKEIIGKILWLISTSRNAIVVITCSLFVYAYTSSDGESIVKLTGTVKSGLPEISPPPFSTTINGRTENFYKMCSELGASIILVPIIAVLGNVAIAKAFSSGDSVDATQELFTLGLCNVIGSFVSSMPVTGSFSRSAVNHASGVRTPMGGLYTGISIILALSLLTPYCYYIPKASLAAVIICAVAFMIEYEVVKPMWTSTRKDLIPALGTFILCLALGVEIGIVIGVALNIILLLIPSARPSLHYEKLKTSCGIEYIMITPGNSLYFPAIDFLRTRICKIGSKYGNSKMAVVIDCRYILGADFTAAKGMSALIQDFKKRKQLLLFFNPRSDVLNVLKCVCSDEFLQIYNTAGLEQVLRRNAQSGLYEANEIVEDVGVVLREVRSDVSITNNAESNIPLLKLQ